MKPVSINTKKRLSTVILLYKQHEKDLNDKIYFKKTGKKFPGISEGQLFHYKSR